MIYFITQDNQFVKIGYTKNNPERRIISLQIGNPRPLQIEKVINGGKSAEDALHIRFADYHIRGEWYWLSDEIRQYINSQEGHSIYNVSDHEKIVSIINQNRKRV